MWDTRSLLKCYAAATLIAIVYGCGLASSPDKRLWPGQGREADRSDYAYVYVAAASKSEVPCTRIPDGVYSVAPFNSASTQISLTKSECFAQVASNAKRPELCDEVVSVSSILYDGSALDRASCRRFASRLGLTFYSGQPYPLVEFMKTLAYEEPFGCPREPAGERSQRTVTRDSDGFQIEVIPVEAPEGRQDLESCAYELWREETSSGRILERLDLIENW